MEVQYSRLNRRGKRKHPSPSARYHMENRAEPGTQNRRPLFERQTMSCESLNGTRNVSSQTAFDVLVVGAGIAGVTAAIEAARAGGRVAIACSGPLFGGSSFYPGTWGLGLIGPQDKADEDDLINTVFSVGCGVADPELVQIFVRGILPAISWLEEELGVELKRPSEEHIDDATYIPCFDHTHRLWRGITRDAFTSAARREIGRLGITVFERCELAHLVQDGHRVTGAVFFQHASGSFLCISAGATILAAGGTSGIFARRLTSSDVPSSVHGIALEAGCTLINIEFMQMMPGLVSPAYGVVFNEKTFRYARFGKQASDITPRDPQALSALLEMRSSHGPFTARLDDEAVDLAIDVAGANGLPLTLAFPEHDAPEFVQTFANWLKAEYGIDPSDTLHVAMFAHASNGGIRICPDTSTGVPGLFACGELTGGMHGADRIGGLSSANGLVFGRVAGMEAATFARAHARGLAQTHMTGAPLDLPSALRPDITALCDSQAEKLTEQLRMTMSTYAMINRTETGLTSALRTVDELESELCQSGNADPGTSPAPRELMNGIRLRSQLALARTMLEAMRARRQSLGSHFRADYPTPHPQA